MCYFLLQNLSCHSIMPNNMGNADFTSIWAQIKPVVITIISGEGADYTVWMETAHYVYKNVCPSEKHIIPLYLEIKKMLKDYIEHLQAEISSDENDIVTNYMRCHGLYHQCCVALDRQFSHLNRSPRHPISWHIERHRQNQNPHYTMNTQKTQFLDYMLEVWREDLNEALKVNLIHSLLRKINQDRNGAEVDCKLVHKVVDSVVGDNQMSNYAGFFKTVYLKTTASHYREELSSLLANLGWSSYLQEVLSMLDGEHQSGKFWNKAQSKVAHRQIEDPSCSFEKNFPQMIAGKQTEDLQNVYRCLLLLEGGTDIIANLLEDHIKQITLKIFSDLCPENRLSTHIVKAVHKVHGEYRDLIQEVFHGDTKLFAALDKALQAATVESLSEIKVPMTIAYYVDSLLKKKKGRSESKLNNELEESMVLFKCLEDKDVYLRIYSRLLERRLLRGLSHSVEAEKGIVARMQQEKCSFLIPSLQQMIADMGSSTELCHKFQSYLQEQKNLEMNIEVSCKILHSRAWPSQNIQAFNIPRELGQPLQCLENFHQSTHAGQKLSWVHAQGSAEVNVNYLRKPHVFIVGTFQVSVLLKFNNQDSVSFQELTDSTHLPEHELRKQLQSLIDAGIILTDGALHKQSVIALNMSYTNKSTKVNLLLKKASKQ